MCVELDVVVGEPGEGGNVHGVVAVVIGEKLLKFGLSCVGSVDVFTYVINGVVVEELVRDVQGVSLVGSEGWSVGTAARRVVGSFAAESRYDLL